MNDKERILIEDRHMDFLSIIEENRKRCEERKIKALNRYIAAVATLNIIEAIILLTIK